jgi:hypothetical protein
MGKGYKAKVSADVTVAESGPPYIVRIDALRINR